MDDATHDGMRALSLVVAIGSLAGCEGPRRTPPAEPAPVDARMLRARMGNHFARASELHVAIIDGRLGAARERAAWLLHREPWWEEGTHSEDLFAAIDTIARARNLLTAAGGMGRLARACGRCHVQRGVQLSATSSAPPAAAFGLTAQMARHAWAADRLWDGLTIPSDLAWSEGTAAINVTSIDLAQTTDSKPNEQVVELAEQLRELSVSGMAARDRDVQAAIYSQMLVTCARCHSIVRTH